MMQLHQLLPLLLLSGGATAFGPILEPKKGGFGSPVSLKLSSDSDHVLDANRLRLERTFLYEVVEDDSDDVLRSYQQYELNEYAEDPWFDLSATAACTDDCEECAIPDEYKTVMPAEEQIDVMAFLGIRRAEPLRVNRKSLEWD